MAKTSFRLSSVAAAMTDLVARGTVTASFDVYSDFLTYKSGTYACPSSGTPLGGHAVSIIGYGTDAAGTDFWTVRNSWNNGWGNGGTFNIQRGTNTCGFESDLVAGTV
jgi:cathepsin B